MYAKPTVLSLSCMPTDATSPPGITEPVADSSNIPAVEDNINIYAIVGGIVAAFVTIVMMVVLVIIVIMLWR